MMSDKKFKVGDKVRYIGTEHETCPQWYPMIGTIGTVKGVDEIDCYIEWAEGSTSDIDCWYCNKGDVELVKDEDMTNEEIWKMLESKMRKSGLKPCGSRLLITNGIANVYAWEDVHNAIALAYKVGYMRSQKGRPFKFGEKKKKGGHWEPVDPKNLPKEGTKVRYSRFCEHHPAIPVANKVLSINSIGTVLYKYKKFGVEVDNSWYCCSRYPERFDMWVEDDE